MNHDCKTSADLKVEFNVNVHRCSSCIEIHDPHCSAHGRGPFLDDAENRSWEDDQYRPGTCFVTLRLFRGPMNFLPNIFELLTSIPTVSCRQFTSSLCLLYSEAHSGIANGCSVLFDACCRQLDGSSRPYQARTQNAIRTSYTSAQFKIA